MQSQTDNTPKLLLDKSGKITGSVIGGVTFMAASAFTAGEAQAAAAGTVPQAAQDAINNSTATINALAPIAIAALATALVPYASMLSIKFLAMITSRV